MTDEPKPDELRADRDRLLRDLQQLLADNIAAAKQRVVPREAQNARMLTEEEATSLLRLTQAVTTMVGPYHRKR